MQGEFVGFAFEDAPAPSFGIVEKRLVAHPVPSDIEEVLEADPVDLQFQHEGRITGLLAALSGMCYPPAARSRIVSVLTSRIDPIGRPLA